MPRGSRNGAGSEKTAADILGYMGRWLRDALEWMWKVRFGGQLAKYLEQALLRRGDRIGSRGRKRGGGEGFAPTPF